MTAAAITLPASIDAEFLPQQATVGQLLERHRARVAEKIARTGTTAHSFSTIEDVRAMQNRMNAAKAAYRTQVGGVTKDELEKLSGGNHQIAHDVHREIQTLQDGQTASGDADDRLLAAVEARGENAGSKGSSNRVLLVTAALFVVLGGMNWGWKSVVFLTVAIALHEIGHVIAMRIFGYKNVRMLFLPMFGGLATGEPRELDATKNALIALAGPAFGVATTGVAIVIALLINQPPWLVQFAWVSLVLNAFNLIPLVPLDGGRFTNDALFSRYPVLELIFRLIAVGGLGWLAFNLEAWLLGGLALFMLITTQVTFRRACLIRDARRDPLWQTRPLDRETVVLLREIVGRIFKGVAPEKFSGKLPEHAHGIWLEIRKRFPGVGGTVGLLSAYVFLCVFIVPGMGFLMVWYLERPTF
jgi:Zn-dependent protease